MRRRRFIGAVLAAALVSAGGDSAGAGGDSAGAGGDSAGAGRAPAESEVRFAAWDVLVDAAERRLAAWQVEVVSPSGRARVVGVEGGDGPAWAEPPRYDPRALAGGRIILAAFRLEGDIPAGRVRVARLHFEIRGDGPPDLRARVLAAATVGGERIEALALLENARNDG